MIYILRPGDRKDGNQDFRLWAAALLGDVLRGPSPFWGEPGCRGVLGSTAWCGEVTGSRVVEFGELPLVKESGDVRFYQPPLTVCPWASHFTSLGCQFPSGKLDKPHIALTFFHGSLRAECNLSKTSKEPCDLLDPLSQAILSSAKSSTVWPPSEGTSEGKTRGRDGSCRRGPGRYCGSQALNPCSCH